MEIRVKILAEDVRSEAARVTAAFKEWMDAGAGGATHWRMEEENYEGWRVKVQEGPGMEGWVLVRPSLHDPGERPCLLLENPVLYLCFSIHLLAAPFGHPGWLLSHSSSFLFRAPSKTPPPPPPSLPLLFPPFIPQILSSM
jgi:hypothetical protein